MLTQDQINNYLTRRGASCPACYSENIEGSSVEIDAGGASQEIYCLECGEEWTDVYSLVDVIQVD